MNLNNFAGGLIVAVAFVFATATFSQAQTFATPQPVQGYIQQGVPVQGQYQIQGQVQRPRNYQTEVIVQAPSKEELGKASLGASFNDAGSAIVVGSVFTNSPAQKAGLQSGDMLRKLNGETIENSGSFNAAISAMEPGGKVTVTRYKNGKETDIEVGLATMADILKASTVAEPGAYDNIIGKSQQQMSVLRQKIKNTEMDLEDMKKALAAQEKDLADLKAKAATAATAKAAADKKAAADRAAALAKQKAAAEAAAEAKADAAIGSQKN
jgi:membrane-associated protease RseP (regulator of RpoE activity)